MLFSILSLALLGCATARRTTPQPLPATILAGYPGNGYTTDGTPNEAVLAAAKNGVNVVIWNFITLQSDLSTGLPLVADQPPLACVAATVKQLQAENLPTVHMISIGGWGAPHPTTTNPKTGVAYTPEEVYSVFNTWNQQAATQYDWNGFDGIDWDMEGANEVSSPINEFTVECLNLVGGISQLAKADGYIVSLVPPESYFDPSTGNFSRSLLFTYPDWVSRGQDFAYHGRNAYAYFIAKYPTTTVNGESVPTFDFVTVQLYETYSHADFNITILGDSAGVYIENLVNHLIGGWEVLFEMDPTVQWNNQWIALNTTQVVIGLANGWAGSPQSLLIMPNAVGQGFAALKKQGNSPRGVAFWDISDEGDVPPNQSSPLYLTIGLNDFLHTRS